MNKKLRFTTAALLGLPATNAWAAVPGDFSPLTLILLMTINFLLLAVIFIGAIVIGSVLFAKLQPKLPKRTKAPAKPHASRQRPQPATKIDLQERPSAC